MKSGNGWPPEPTEQRRARVERELQTGTHDRHTEGEHEVSPKLLKVMERAKRDPQTRFTSLAHLIDEDALKHAYEGLRKDAAVGVDGVTKEQYGLELESNIAGLLSRMKAMRYRHQPLRRVHIPKAKGRTRPIAISSVEDKIVQGAIRDVLEAIYEPVFKDCSYGFRPGRSAHDAMRTLSRMLDAGEVNWILEADIESFFDSIDRKMLMEMLQERVADPSLLRLIGKCLHVGILDGDEYSESDEGTAQGSSLSPLLGNVYLHHVLDEWVERDVLPRMRGKAHLIRYCDDFVIGFEREDDAKRVMDVLRRRFERYGLRLHPEKTRLLSFARPPEDDPKGKGPATFDLLGFTVYWRRTRSGWWRPSLKTRKASFQKAVKAIADWCRRHRHLPVKDQHAALKRRIEGHFNYFGVSWNLSSLKALLAAVPRVWGRWLRCRGQRNPITWKRFWSLLQRYPLPRATIRVAIW